MSPRLANAEGAISCLGCLDEDAPIRPEEDAEVVVIMVLSRSERVRVCCQRVWTRVDESVS